jgi:hypothetical protein
LQPSLTRAEYRNLLTYLAGHLVGVDPGLARHTGERARAIANRHHILDLTDGSPRRLLDFESGREVLL